MVIANASAGIVSASGAGNALHAATSEFAFHVANKYNESRQKEESQNIPIVDAYSDTFGLASKLVREFVRQKANC